MKFYPATIACYANDAVDDGHEFILRDRGTETAYQHVAKPSLLLLLLLLKASLLLTGLGQVDLHLLRRLERIIQQGAQTIALARPQGRRLLPLTDVILIVPRHATGHLGHEPGVAVVGGVVACEALGGRGVDKLVFGLGVEGEVVAAGRRLVAENVVEDDTLVLGDAFVWGW